MNNEINNQPTSEQIAKCAYQIWENEGGTHGRHENHWLQAEKQLKADCAQDAGALSRPVSETLLLPAAVERSRSVRRSQSKHAKAIAR